MTAAKDRTTVVGVFHDRADADRAVDELRKAGFRNDQIGVVAKRDKTHGDTAVDDEGSEAGSGAVAGMLAGAGIGGLVGLGIIAPSQTKYTTKIKKHQQGTPNIKERTKNEMTNRLDRKYGKKESARKKNSLLKKTDHLKRNMKIVP